MSNQLHENAFLGCCELDPAIIDRAVSEGLTADHFKGHKERAYWSLLLEQRTKGAPTDLPSILAAAAATGRLESIGGYAGAAEITRLESGTTTSAGAYLSLLLTAYARREAWKILNRGKEMVEADGCALGEVGKMAEDLAGICAGKQKTNRSTETIVDEAEADAQAVITGAVDNRVTVITGFSSFDRKATPMYSHEYVVVGGRSSHGKSSLMMQIAGNNLARGLKVVIFTLETSDKAVVKQLAGQRSMVDLRQLAVEPKDRQAEYLKRLKWLKDCKNLLIFDRDLSIESIQARCRMLAQSFQPNLVIIDYLGLIQGRGDSLYERTSAASKAMIPLQKSLGCTLMAGCQLNQESEKDKREPGRTDFRDTGTILDDAHRIIQVWRKPDQFIDQNYYDCELLQVKLRDGPLVKQPCKFHAPTTRFIEEVNANV